MRLSVRYEIPPKDGLALVVRREQHLRLIDLEGKQVIDMAVFNRDNTREKLSTSYSRTRVHPMPRGNDRRYGARDKLVGGDALFSTICRPMMIFVAETAAPKGVHDVHHRMCNSYMYESAGVGPRDGCLETISRVVAPHGVMPEDLPDPLNVFMNYEHIATQGRWVIREPVTRPGDYIEFVAVMDCLIGLSNCPDDVVNPTNGMKCTRVGVEVYE
jgi:uncharacterized protein